jgi:hypothetical protein
MKETAQTVIDRWHDCEPALRLFRLMHQSYHNVLDRCPQELSVHMRAVNGLLFDELRDTMIAALSEEDIYAVCAFVVALLDYHPTLIDELSIQ